MFTLADRAAADRVLFYRILARFAKLRGLRLFLGHGGSRALLRDLGGTARARRDLARRQLGRLAVLTAAHAAARGQHLLQSRAAAKRAASVSVTTSFAIGCMVALLLSLSLIHI